MLTLVAVLSVVEVSEAQILHRTRNILVSPADEITVIDPGTNSEFKPEPYVANRQVEIPPTLLVHNFYYTGDRDFRGPVFPGGPSVVVVEHPKTGIRMYVDVQMLPGSPRVVYRSHYIDYHFGKQKIRIQFCNLLDPLHYHQPIVKYCHGNTRIQKALSSSPPPNHVKDWMVRTGIPESLTSAGKSGKALLNRSADGIKRTTEVITTPIKVVSQATMLGSLLTPDPEGDATASRDAAVRRASTELSNRDLSIPTLR